jgi:hypothetical protein
LLITFPSEAVQLKKSFGFQPWLDSEENIGNLLMVCPKLAFISLGSVMYYQSRIF